MSNSQTPKISLFTPTNDPSFLEEAYASLKVQTEPDWEWVILPNGDFDRRRLAPYKMDFLNDPRVRVEWKMFDQKPPAGSEGHAIGEVKRIACELCRAPYLVELDHDDYLHEVCLQRLLEAFEGGADFVYSGFAEFHDKTMQPNLYSADCGWEYFPLEYRGVTYQATLGFPPEPQYLLLIQTGPNHVRSWRADKYWEIGGHRNYMAGDDYDLYMRFYLAGMKIKRVDECLYFYRLRQNNENSFLKRNDLVHQTVNNLYQEYVELTYLRMSESRGLLALDLGSRGAKPKDPRWTGVDKKGGEGVDAIVDLDDPTRPWPWVDGSVGLVRAVDLLQYIQHPVHFFNEAWRVLAPDGMLITEVPSTDDGQGKAGRGAFMAPGARGPFYNPNSFWYYTKAEYNAQVPGLHCAFFPLRNYAYYATKWHADNYLPYVRTHLVAIKPGMAGPPPIAGSMYAPGLTQLKG